MPPAAATLADLETPALLLSQPRMAANIARMNARAAALGVRLRPHVKTAKSLPVLRAMQPLAGTSGGPGAITVSTLREADVFAAHSWRDITYAVGFTPNKRAHAARLLAQGVALTVIVDSSDAAAALADAAPTLPAPLRVLIEVDTDGQRAGLPPDDARLLAIAARLARAPGLRLDGVLTHHGGSYACRGDAALRAAAEAERAGIVAAAERLRAAGHAAPVVSVGSTPTALFAAALPGVTELRAGVYVFQDLVMAGLGVCGVDDIAASVLTSVIGHRRDRGWTLVDAGWMALSRDRGTATQAVDQGYGLVCDADGRVIGEHPTGAAAGAAGTSADPIAGDWIVSAVNQEHGIVSHRSGRADRLLDLPVGTLLRVLPNHACATCAAFDAYQVLDGAGRLTERWPRFTGW